MSVSIVGKIEILFHHEKMGELNLSFIEEYFGNEVEPEALFRRFYTPGDHVESQPSYTSNIHALHDTDPEAHYF